MNLKTRPLLMAAGAGLVVQTIFVVINLGVGIMPYLAGTTPLDPDYSGIIQAVGSLICVCLLIIDIGVGFLYTFLGARESALTAGNGALGGAAAGLIARLLSSLINGCLGVLVVPLLISQVVTGAGFGEGLAATLFASGLSLCLFLIFGGIFGAIGGAVGGATVGKRADVATPG